MCVQIIKDLVTLFPVIRDWIAEFLLDIRDMTASEIGRNMLIEQVQLTRRSLTATVVCTRFSCGGGAPGSRGEPSVRQNVGSAPSLLLDLFPVFCLEESEKNAFQNV